MSNDKEPYNSYVNGAAMRVSPVAYVVNSLEEVIKLSERVTELTHNHPEGIKGAEATAVSIYMACTGESLESIRDYMIEHYYPMDMTCADLRATYRFDGSCQGTVPQAMLCFFESGDFEDALRTAVSIGGDSDTVAAICGSIAGAYYEIPKNIRLTALSYMDQQ